MPTRIAGHVLLLSLAMLVTATTTFTPVQRVMHDALESFSFEDAATSEAPFARAFGDIPFEEPVFTPPSEEMLALLKPRPSIVAHVVQPGDNVAKLATHYRITPQTIVWANNLSDPDKLPIGHALLILPMSGVLHPVRPGETIEALAERYQIAPDAIADANGLALGKQLGINEQVVIPGGRPLEPTRPQVTTRAIDRADPPMLPPSGAPARIESLPAVPTPAPLKPLKSQSYEVDDGDSLVSIARRFGVSTATIILANGLTVADADAIKIGQKLIVPPVDGVIHKVAEGDSVRAIAESYEVETSAVIKANALIDPFVVIPGQELIVPGARVPEPAPPVPTEPEVAYKVAFGDSVASIGDRFGVDPRVIARRNGLDRAEHILPGLQLLIPGGRERSAAGSAVRAPAPKPQTQNALQAAAALVKAPVARQVAAPAPQPVVPATNPWSMLEVASKFLGYAYVWGGHSPRVGFDCTGFTWYVFGQVGKWLPNHDLWGQLQSGPRVGRGNLQPGDLVFFVNTYQAGLSHVGIYLGANRFIHAGSERTGVTITSLNDPYWAPRYYGASRPW